MKRLIEPEIMDNKQQVEAYSQADFSSSDRNMFIRFENLISSIGFKICSESLIVDIGCGPGNFTEKLSQRWPCTKVIGIDGSSEMLKVARRRKLKLRAKGHCQNLEYINKNLNSFSKGKFVLAKPAEIVVSNSLLHHIHDPNQFWKAIQNIAKKGSFVFHRDLRRPVTIAEAIAIREKYQPNAPAVLARDFLASLQAAFTVDEVRQQLQEAGMCQLKVFNVDDRYLEVSGVL